MTSRDDAHCSGARRGLSVLPSFAFAGVASFLIAPWGLFARTPVLPPHLAHRRWPTIGVTAPHRRQSKYTSSIRVPRVRFLEQLNGTENRLPFHAETPLHGTRRRAV